MGVSEILAQIDHEIAQLQHARSVLGGKAAPAAKKGCRSSNRQNRQEKKEEEESYS